MAEQRGRSTAATEATGSPLLTIVGLLLIATLVVAVWYLSTTPPS